MSKEKRALNEKRADLKKQVAVLEGRLASATNQLGKDLYSQKLEVAKREYQRLNAVR